MRDLKQRTTENSGWKVQKRNRHCGGYVRCACSVSTVPIFSTVRRRSDPLFLCPL